jgi:hypothetical protein
MSSELGRGDPASLRPDYVLDDVVKASETGALGGTSSPEVRGNKAPTVHVQELTSRTVKVGTPITMITDVKDDGIPKRRAPRKVPVHATFSAPGTYVLHCRAADGALVADDEVTIVVTK